jgi:hypothetical protein
MLRTPSPSDWSSHFAEHFFQRTGNIFTTYVMSPDTLETRLAVARPRLLGLLAALCLGAEAAALGDVELAADFCQIAAGTMILEQRVRSKPPAEIIMLAQS